MKDPVTAIIVDDEQDARDGLEKHILHNFPDISIIAKAENARCALDIIMKQRPELLFLEIQMPVHDGFWLVERLKNLDNNPCVIFVTAYDQYAIQAIHHAAFDFLTKPIDPGKLKEAISRFMEERDKFNFDKKLDQLKTYLFRDKLRFNTAEGFILIAPKDITYCEADRNYSYLHLFNGKSHFITAQLGSVEKKLGNNGNFVRISRSVLINMNYIERFIRKSKTVVLSDILHKYELKASVSGTRRLLSV